jgi:hypothetical protein
MQMRSCAVWCVSLIGLCLVANPVWAAPKKKKKHKADDTAEPAQVEEAAAPVSDEPKDIDSLMDDSTKKKSAAPVKKQEIAEPDPDKPLYNDDSSTASAWERPPAEAEKPKKKKKSEIVEEAAHKGDGNNMNIGISAGYGIGMSGGLTSLNPYGLGVGLTADYEISSHWVFGIGGEFFLGSSDPNAGNNLGTPKEDYARYILTHLHAGYNIWLTDTLYLRPSIWMGVAIGMVPGTAALHSNGLSITALVSPGLTLHYLLGPKGWYVGADIRYSWPWGQDNSIETGILTMLNFGKRF